MDELLGLDVIINFLKSENIDTREKDVYEFGVCTGGSLEMILNVFKKQKIKYNKCWGFDSLEGLPKEDPSQSNPELWKENEFNVQSIKELSNEDEAIKYLYEKLGMFNFELIPGYFSESLTENLIKEKKFKPAVFLHIDVDLYISSLQTLEFMYKNNLIIKDTIIRYDEWGCEDSVRMSGEERSHREMIEKYRKQFDILYHYEGVKILICK